MKWPPVVSLSIKQHPYCLVLVGIRRGFKHDVTISFLHNQIKLNHEPSFSYYVLLGWVRSF